MLLAAGCTNGPSTPDATVQLNGLLRAALTGTIGTGTVNSRLAVTWEAGSQPFQAAQGSATLWFARGIATANLTLAPGGPMAVISTPSEFAEGHPSNTRQHMAWIRVSLLNLSRAEQDRLPQIQAPGIDPFQLTTLLSAVFWSAAVPSEQPVFVADSAGGHVEYQVVVNTAELASHVPMPAKTWLAVMSKEPGGALIGLSVTVASGKITSIVSDLPVPGPPKQFIAKAKSHGLILPLLHAIVVLHLSYK